MAILKVARLGHPVLRVKAAAVARQELDSPDMQRFIDDMIDTMHEYHGVGIAAPQVHVSKQIFVCEARSSLRYPDAPDIPLTVVVNPVLSKLSAEKDGMWEGCLSIPDMRGVVPRHESLVCEGWDRKGGPLRLEVSGFFARVIQHEWDHLQGNVYIDRMPDLKTLSHLDEYARYHAEE